LENNCATITGDPTPHHSAQTSLVSNPAICLHWLRPR
jgi:hypothetical protein